MSVDARLDVNVALNRTSYQVSTWMGTNYAKYANDGGHGTHLGNGPCMATNTETNPWWAVDLGMSLYVDSVKFTNIENSGKLICLSAVSASVWLKYVLFCLE